MFLAAFWVGWMESLLVNKHFMTTITGQQAHIKIAKNQSLGHHHNRNAASPACNFLP